MRRAGRRANQSDDKPVRETQMTEFWGTENDGETITAPENGIDQSIRLQQLAPAGGGSWKVCIDEDPAPAVVPVQRHPPSKSLPSSALRCPDFDAGLGLGVANDGRVIKPRIRPRGGLPSLSRLARTQKPFKDLGTSDANKVRGGRPSRKKLEEAWARHEQAQTQARTTGVGINTRRAHHVMHMVVRPSFPSPLQPTFTQMQR